LSASNSVTPNDGSSKPLFRQLALSINKSNASPQLGDVALINETISDRTALARKVDPTVKKTLRLPQRVAVVGAQLAAHGIEYGDHIIERRGDVQSVG